MDTSFERSRDGLGLGLVKTPVEMHEGTVEVRSTGLGEGSEFVVRLPTLSGTPQPPLNAPTPATARRILVVDDSLHSAQSLATLLELTGHET